jgi:AmiR/NasT family two-component response regulator
MLMTAESISEGDAYARMRSASQRTGQPLRAIAEALLATLSSTK